MLSKEDFGMGAMAMIVAHCAELSVRGLLDEWRAGLNDSGEPLTTSERSDLARQVIAALDCPTCYLTLNMLVSEASERALLIQESQELQLAA